MDKPIPEAVTWPLSILEAGNWREVYMGTKHMRLEVSYPYEVWERLMAAIAAAQQQPAGDAEAKTVPVPTRVHLIGETAVIVGTPERGWDEDAQDAHNCDDMGCSTVGPHVLARVPFTDERALSQQPAAVDEAAAIRAFEEHFQASSDDPYFEGELELWLTAWRKALAAQRGGRADG